MDAHEMSPQEKVGMHHKSQKPLKRSQKAKRPITEMPVGEMYEDLFEDYPGTGPLPIGGGPQAQQGLPELLSKQANKPRGERQQKNRRNPLKGKTLGEALKNVAMPERGGTALHNKPPPNVQQ